jgi:glycine C-acetyltransferase
MTNDRFATSLTRQLAELDGRGSPPRRHEDVVVEVVAPSDGHGHRVRLATDPDRLFVRMNSNGYLGAAWWPETVAAEEAATRRFGTGPSAVRFISGTCELHVELEARLARFHGREAAMLFSAAYATVLGVLVPLAAGTASAALISDELNHNCIINATRLAAPAAKLVYPHLDMQALDAALGEAARRECTRAVVVTDGVFSMRGDHAPLAEVVAVVARHAEAFADGAVLVVDDSHGVGAFGATGRGTEEVTGARADVLIATLGKALGVNGGYVTGSALLVDVLRETAPTYIYSNPITPGEAAAALASLDVVESAVGRERLARLQASTLRLRDGLARLGFETVPGEHPVVALMVRDTARTTALVGHLRSRGVLATGLGYPVVPRGDEEIRFQMSADHTDRDVDLVLDALAEAPTSTG